MDNKQYNALFSFIWNIANDLPNSRKKGYLILGAYDNGGNVGGDVVENIVENIAENIVDSIVEKLSTTRAKIVRIIWKNPNATAQSISKEINIASRNVQEHLRKLQEQGVIRRIGPDKGGHWEIIAP